MNIELSRQIVDRLVEAGVSTFIVCAGARNSPLVKVLSASSGLDVLHFFDERAASFFAVGRIKADGRPVAVVTTSGTAVSETISAAIEAQYSGLPLVLVTADRPRSYRGKGAPQAIDQVGIFSHYVKVAYDIATPDEVPQRLTIDSKSATQVNVCFDEPLIDQEQVENVTYPVGSPSNLNVKRSDSRSLVQFLDRAKRPLVICGEIPFSARGLVAEFLVALNSPVYAESTSQLLPIAEKIPLLRGGAHLLKQWFVDEKFDSVIRIGGVPTLRLWRDFEDRFSKVPVLAIGDLEFSGLSREIAGPVSFATLAGFLELGFDPAESTDLTEAVLSEDAKRADELHVTLNRHPWAEQSLIQAFAALVPDGSDIFVGNSLPIRELDLVAPLCFAKRDVRVFANRGANGIDGLIATGLGVGVTGRHLWILVGDLSALYDLNALAFAKHCRASSINVVVVNNAGGRIFSRMFNDPAFENRHEFEFSHWAKMFGFSYCRVGYGVEIARQMQSSGPRVMELVPDEASTERVWKAIETRQEETRA